MLASALPRDGGAGELHSVVHSLHETERALQSADGDLRAALRRAAAERDAAVADAEHLRAALAAQSQQLQRSLAERDALQGDLAAAGEELARLRAALASRSPAPGPSEPAPPSPRLSPVSFDDKPRARFYSATEEDMEGATATLLGAAAVRHQRVPVDEDYFAAPGSGSGSGSEGGAAGVGDPPPLDLPVAVLRVTEPPTPGSGPRRSLSESPAKQAGARRRRPTAASQVLRYVRRSSSTEEPSQGQGRPQWRQRSADGAGADEAGAADEDNLLARAPSLCISLDGDATAALQQMLLAPDRVLLMALLRGVAASARQAAMTAVLTVFAAQGRLFELLCWTVDQEVAAVGVGSAGALFRRDSPMSRLLGCFARVVNGRFIADVLGPLILALSECEQLPLSELELDPTQLDVREKTAKVAHNGENLMRVASQFFTAITQAQGRVPGSIRHLCAHLRQCAQGEAPVASVFFLRFICPAITSPRSFDLMPAEPRADGRRALILVAKLLQNLASGVEFGRKEPYMKAANPFIRGNADALREFADGLCTPPASSAERDATRDMGLLQPPGAALRDLAVLIAQHAQRICDAVPVEHASVRVGIADVVGSVALPSSSSSSAASASSSAEKRRSGSMWRQLRRGGRS